MGDGRGGGGGKEWPLSYRHLTVQKHFSLEARKIVWRSIVYLVQCAPDYTNGFPYGAFCRSSHASDLKMDTPVITLPGASCCRVSTGSGWPGVSIP